MRNIPFVISIFLLGAYALARQSHADNPSPQAANPPDSGTICVLPNSPDPPTRISPGGDYNPSTLTISLDQRPPIPWPHKTPTKIEAIPRSGRHLITLHSDGKRIQSFWFRFSDYKDSTLCVSYDGYQGVQFGDKHTTYCKCR